MESSTSEANNGGVAGCHKERRESSDALSASLLKQLESLEQRLGEVHKENCELKDTAQKIEAENEELKCHLYQTTAESEKLKQCLDQSKTENEKLSHKVSRQKQLAKTQRFCFKNIQDSNDDVLFYTGLPSSSVFYQLFQYLNSEEIRSNVVYHATAQSWAANQSADPSNASWRETSVTQGRPAKLSKVNQLFLTLVHLRLNLKEHDLSRRFEISLSSVSECSLHGCIMLAFALVCSLSGQIAPPLRKQCLLLSKNDIQKLVANATCTKSVLPRTAYN